MWTHLREIVQRVRLWRRPQARLAAWLAAPLLILAGCSSSTVGPVPTSTATTAPTATATAAPVPPTPTAGSSGPYHVFVYFSRKPDSLNDPSKVYPVDRFSPTLAVATYAMQQLIAGPSASETAAGYFSEIHGLLSGSSNCGGPDFLITLDHKGPAPATGYATVKFCRTVNLPGDLAGAYISAEIKAIILQFPNNHHVVILDKQGGCFDDLSGQNLCLS